MNQIKQKIEEIGLSQREISKRLGKNASYLAGVFRTGLSTAKQAELLEKLEVVVGGGTLMSDEELMKDLFKQLDRLKKGNAQLRSESDKYFNELNSLKETLEYKQQHLIQSQKYLMIANQNCELFETKYRKIALLNWALCTALVAVLILWVVV